MVSLTEVERQERAKEIIDEAARTTAGAAALLAQGAFLGADVLPQTALSIKMVVELGELFGQRIEKSTAIVLLGQAAGLSAGVGGTRALWGIIPILGNAVNAGATFIHTNIMGWSIYNYFKTEEKFKKVFKESSAEEVKVTAPSEGVKVAAPSEEVKEPPRPERERRESPESNAVRA